MNKFSNDEIRSRIETDNWTVGTSQKIMTQQLAENERLLEQIGDWKNATGLVDGNGDPGGIEPKHLRTEIARLLSLSACECMNYACSTPEGWERLIAGKHHSGCNKSDPRISLEPSLLREAGKVLAKFAELDWSKQPLVGAELNGLCAKIAGRLEQEGGES